MGVFTWGISLRAHAPLPRKLAVAVLAFAALVGCSDNGKDSGQVAAASESDDPTEEQTVAFLITGIDGSTKFDPKKLFDPGSKMPEFTMKATGKSPVVFEGSTASPDGMQKLSHKSVTTKTGDCLYLVEDDVVLVKGQINIHLQVTQKANLKKLTEIKRLERGDGFLLEGAEISCQKVANGVTEDCTDGATEFFTASIEQDRLSKALAFYRANFCKEAAF